MIKTITSLQEITNCIQQGACAAVGWKTRRPSTSQPKLVELTASADTTPVPQPTVSTWSVVACVKPSTQVRPTGPSGRGTMVTTMRLGGVRRGLGPLPQACPGVVH